MEQVLQALGVKRCTLLGFSDGGIVALVLVVRGDDDHLTALEDAVELRGRLPEGHLLGIPFAGHVAHDEGREVFVPALRRFLAG